MSENAAESQTEEISGPPPVQDDPEIIEYFQRSKEPSGEDRMIRRGEYKAATDD
jgi:hypothetical protein